MTHTNHKGSKCFCCVEEVKSCPLCGSRGVIYGQNMVGCIDVVECGLVIDWGGSHSIYKNKPLVHWVIKHWNTRVNETNTKINET